MPSLVKPDEAKQIADEIRGVVVSVFFETSQAAAQINARDDGLAAMHVLSAHERSAHFDKVVPREETGQAR